MAASRATWISAGILCTAAVMWCSVAGQRLSGVAICAGAFLIGMIGERYAR